MPHVGKSAASRVLEEKGFCLIDADETAKLLMAKGEPLHKKATYLHLLFKDIRCSRDAYM